MKGTRRPIGGRQRLVGIGGAALTAALAVFHGRLLLQRLADGSLLQPIVVARWAVSVVLVLALLRLWSRGLPLLRGRRAGVLWLVVVLLHAATPGASLPAVEQGLLPAALVALAALAFTFARAPRRAAAAAGRPALRRLSRPRRRDPGWYRVLFSRPPPVRLHP